MKKIALIFLCLLIAFPVSASEIWVTSPQLTSREILESIATDHRAKIKESDFESIFNIYLSHPITSEMQSTLLKGEDVAQAAALNGHFEKALNLYLQLLMKLELLPNVSGVEKITLSALVHVAELKDILKSPEAQSSWRQAHSWSGHQLTKESEFSPQSIKRFNGMKAIGSRAVVDITCPIEAWVYIDGRRIRASNNRFREYIEPGIHQVAVLTPGSEWMIKKIAIQDGETQEVTLRPESIVEGDCDKPHYVGSGLPSKTRLLVAFNSNCDRIYYNKAWYFLDGKPLERIFTPSNTTTSLLNEMLAQPQEKPWYEKMSHSGWFWVGLGAAVIGSVALVIQNQNQQTTVIPTQTVQ